MRQKKSTEPAPNSNQRQLLASNGLARRTFRHFRLSTVLAVIAAMAACLTAFVQANRPHIPDTAHELMLWELECAVSADYAVIFVQLDWTFLIQERQFFGKFANIYNYGGVGPKANFHVINFTSVTDGYGPLAALPGWNEHDPGPNCHQINGKGEIIWLKNGTIVGIGRQDHIATPEEAVRMTQDYFGRQARNTPDQTAA